MTDRLEVDNLPEDASTADVFSRITDAIFALDEEWRFTFLNEPAEAVLRRDEEDLLGEVIWEEFPETVGSTFQRKYERAMETQKPVTFEAFYPPHSAWFEVRAYPTETGLSVYFRDVTERIRRENELEGREQTLRRAYEVIADTDPSFPEQVRTLLTVVRETLGTDYATLSRVYDDEYTFEVVDAPSAAALQEGDSVPLETTNCERVVATEQTLVLEDVEADAPELADRAGNAEWGIACYLGAPVTVDGEVYGTFCFYDMEARTEEFSDWEVTFVELLSNWVSHELERRRYTGRLAALNELNGVVREITDAAIDTSTREEIEAVTCECLAAADSYLFAWIGEADPATREIKVHTEAGVENCPGGATVSVDPGTEGSLAPAREALRTGEMQTVQNIRDDSTYDPWRAGTDGERYRSMAAVPIAHAESVYGVLNVYSGRRDAFEDEEGSVIGHLGGLLGHAIAAVDRKQMLTSDTVVELEFRVQGAFADRDSPDPDEASIVYDEVVPAGDGEFLVYGTASEEALASLAESDNYEPHCEGLTHTGEGADGVSFELRLSEPPLLSTLASLGAAIERAVVDGNDYWVTVHLSPDVDVRQVFASVRDTYPDAEVLSKQRVDRPVDPTRRVSRAMDEELTDRQLTVLRTAHAAGFFEWPRARSGEEVAESLDITSATFHQHLRAAQNKLFDAILGDSSRQ